VLLNVKGIDMGLLDAAIGLSEVLAKHRQSHGLTLEVPIIKTDSEEQFVLGIVLEPDFVDAQGDVVSREEIRQAAHDFLAEVRTRGLQHSEDLGERVKIVESYVAPADFQLDDFVVKAGTWLMGWTILDKEIWQGVKTGQYTGFSIGGSARREAL
jgi:DNA adenine methylase